jgi:hypothetical protein
LSPPRIDPFTGKPAASNAKETEANTYKEIMQDVFLDKEKQEVLMKIKKKKMEEEHEKALANQKKGKKTTGWDQKSPSQEVFKEDKSGWRLDVMKNGDKVESLYLNPDITYQCGRDSVTKCINIF